MKTLIAIAAALTLVAPVSSLAATKHAKPTSTVYVCKTCHMHFSAADAKKDHFKDPMDGGMLMPMKATMAKNSSTMGGMKM
jgi:hypothetical protein